MEEKNNYYKGPGAAALAKAEKPAPKPVGQAQAAIQQAQAAARPINVKDIVSPLPGKSSLLDKGSLAFSPAPAESDVLHVDTSVVQPAHSAPAGPEVALMKYTPILGKPGNLLLRSDRGYSYYTFTVPKDWAGKDAAKNLPLVLSGSEYLDEVEGYNQQKTIKPGQIVFIPLNYIKSELQDGSFATIHVDKAITKKSLAELAWQYCEGDPEQNAKVVQLYSNLADLSETGGQRWVRIPTGLLKSKYKEKYTAK